VNAFTGIILKQTGSYVYVFAYFAGTYLLALLALQLLIPRIGNSQTRPPEPLVNPTGQLATE